MSSITEDPAEDVQQIRKELKRKCISFSVRLPENLYNILSYIVEKDYLTKQQVVIKALEKPIKEWAAQLYKEADAEIKPRHYQDERPIQPQVRKPILGGLF